MMAPGSATIASMQRQKAAGAYGPSANVVRKMTTRMKQLQEELALESVTNIEFEESSRRSFEFLTGQVKTLKEAFNTLTDTFLQELESLSGAIGGEFLRLEEGILKDVGDTLQKSEQLERHTETLSKDLDAVLSVIPKIEDTMLRTNHHVQDRLEQVSIENGRSSTALQLLEDKVNRIESDLREDMDQKLLKQQRSITRQLESMSRVLMTTDDNRRDEKTSHSLAGSGLGGPSFGGDRASGGDRNGSPRREREWPSSPWKERHERASDQIPSPWRDQDKDRDRDRDRAMSDKGCSDKSSLRLPTESRRTGDESVRSYRGATSGGLESGRDRLSSVQDSPRQSSRRGNSPESYRASERMFQDPRQARRDSQDGPAQASSPRSGHIQMDFDISRLQGSSPVTSSRPR